MYKRVEYKKVIEDALQETNSLMERFPELSVYKAIQEQILQIREDVLVRKSRMTLFEIVDKYTLGAIAVKNFDLEHQEYAQKLSDIAGLSYKYLDLPE